MRVATPNDPKLSDRGVRRGTCMAGGKAAAEAGAVTHGAVRCSAWLGVAAVGLKLESLGDDVINVVVSLNEEVRVYRCDSVAETREPR